MCNLTLSNLSSSISFKQYINLPIDQQMHIDNIVKERTVARLIIKNSLNNRVRNELSETYSVNNDACYPNTISEALSLMATFKSPVNNNSSPTEDDAVVSYHETNDTIHNAIMDDSSVTNPEDDQADDNHIDSIDNGSDEISKPSVSFDATVMAAIIAEATTEANTEQFFGASFDQLQDVSDAYKADEPDVVCMAHIIDTNINDDDVITPIDNTKRGEYPNPYRDFEMIIYHTSQRVNNKNDVYTINYDQRRPDLISYHYSAPCAGSVIDYSDAIRIKLKLAGIHDSTDLMSIFENHTDEEASAIFKRQLNDVDQQGLKTSTVRLLKEETFRSLQHANYNYIRYDQMITEIGGDVDLETFPKMNVLLHHVVSAVAINQRRRRPNRWVNRVTQKLIDCDINTIDQLEVKLDDGTLNRHIQECRRPKFHQVTIHGFQLILGTADFRRGRS
jgi:hypothetical protein